MRAYNKEQAIEAINNAGKVSVRCKGSAGESFWVGKEDLINALKEYKKVEVLADKSDEANGIFMIDSINEVTHL